MISFHFISYFCLGWFRHPPASVPEMTLVRLIRTSVVGTNRSSLCPSDQWVFLLSHPCVLLLCIRLKMCLSSLFLNQMQRHLCFIHAQTWVEALLNDKVNSIVSKGNYKVVPRPSNPKVRYVRWVFAIQQEAMGNIQRHKGRVVAKGSKQVEGIDFNETYAPVCDHITGGGCYL
jgi:hypothetical protein